MNDETSASTVNIDAIIEEIQTVNKGISSNGKKLDQITEYLIAKDQAEQTEKEEALKAEEEAKKAEEEQSEADAKIAEEKAAQEQDEQETYTEIVTDIRDQVVLTNNLLSGQIFFMGVLFGLLFLKIFWDRFIK